MKKIFIICAVLLITASVFLSRQVAAQAPEKFSYQAVVRDNNDKLLVNTQIGVKISIQFLSEIPPYYFNFYTETHTPTTNENGLVSLIIGDGVVEEGVFADIDWSDGAYYIKTEIDPKGGTNYTINEKTQLLSVPYALYAKNVKTYKVGDFVYGGIVFWVDETGQHGLVCAKYNQSSGAKWYAGTNIRTMATGNGPKAGFMNTAIIIASQGYGDGTNYVARICNELKITEGAQIISNTYGDWYLPSLEELKLMYENKAIINATAAKHGGSSFSSVGIYWSSTQYGPPTAWCVMFKDGSSSGDFKVFKHYVRAVRAF